MKKERRLIVVCASWEDEENLNLFLSQMIEETKKTDYVPVCITFDRNIVVARGEEGMREFMSLFEMKNLSAIVLLGEMIRLNEINEKLIQMAYYRQIPVFMLERTYSGCINLQLDYNSGFEEIVRHMVFDHQCRNVVMVAGFEGNSFSESRIDICRKVLEEAGSGLPPEKVLYGDFWDMPAIRALREYFAAGGELPDAFICANDVMAIAVCKYLNDQGYAVPGQVKVSGFDGIILGERNDPMITSATPNFGGIVGQMIEKIENWKPENAYHTENWMIPFTLNRRESCGCAEHSQTTTIKVISKITQENQDSARHVRRMGRFIRQTINLDSLEEMTVQLPSFLDAWPDPYYCYCVLSGEKSEYAETILHGENGKYTHGERFLWHDSSLPNYDEVISNREICIFLAHLLQTRDEIMGFMVYGAKTWNLREEQRFEEEVIFISTVISAILNNRRLKEANAAIRRIAEHDYLTGLFNRRGFFEHLEQMLLQPEMKDRYLVLFSIDLDGLKEINDVHGHGEGDYAIQCIGHALEHEAGERGAAARYGGDEFALALFMDEPPAGVDPYRTHIEEYAHRLCAGKPYSIGASMGFCIRKVGEHMLFEQMLAEADVALYEDKKQRKTGRK